MKKVFLSIALCAALLLPAVSQAAEVGGTPPGNPVDLLTGEVWMQSKPENKQAFLFGIDTALAIEKAADELMAKSGKKNVPTVSRFNQEWNNAFHNTTRPEIIEQVDQWYNTHPGNLNRPVMAVIWYEIIQPRVGQSK